ncbi:hypothetical protein [Propionibacterium sp.]|uniref:hypothetical protein n=1 Tax=Propionibacterium sp. TaxID=1977903 RepID=UPI0039E99A99
MATDRFVTVARDAYGEKVHVNWDIIEKARFCSGFKGYVTTILSQVEDASHVIDAYHDVWHVEQSLPMAISDLRAARSFITAATRSKRM